MGKCKFSGLWLDNDKYKSWIAIDSKFPTTKAFCKLCKKSIDVSNMGESALTSHMKSVKHIKSASAGSGSSSLSAFYMSQPKGPSSVSETPSSSKTIESSATVVTESSSLVKVPSAVTESSLTKFVTKDNVLTAEILWTFCVVSCHYSYKSSECMNRMFSKMFPDSEMAKKFSCGESKVAYLTSFGIAPYLKNLNRNRLKSEKHYVLLFDESLNKQLQEKQLDVHIRYWEANKVITKYYSSYFLGHAKSDYLLEKLRESAADNGKRSILQVSMDGPNVNWKLYDLLQKELQEEYGHELLNIGSCGLHILHNAFKAGHIATNWEIDQWLSSLYRLFKDSPARRDDFTSLTGFHRFPLKFCAHRWIENVPVAERALEVWPKVKEFMKAAKEGKFTEPHNKSYSNLEKFALDPLLEIKVEIFLSISRAITPFLTKYQTDAPMLPFLATDMHGMLRALVDRFIKDDKNNFIFGP